MIYRLAVEILFSLLIFPEWLSMQAELSELESKIDHVVALCRRLWSENQTLRDQVIQEQTENRKLNDKMSTVLTRLETMLTALPQPEPISEERGVEQ